MQINSVQNYTHFQGLGSKYLAQDRREENNNSTQRYYIQESKPEIKTKHQKWYENPYYINQPTVTKTTNPEDYKISPKARNILATLNAKEVKESKGKNLDDKFVVNTIGYLINSANPKEKSEIIDKMAELRKINYNKFDENEISILEHILNAEDSDLLNLANNAYARLDYYSPLDYAYENIQNPHFKEEVDKLNLNFKTLKEAVKSENIDVVSDVADDFYSPFYKREVQGKEIGRIVLDAKDLNFYDIFTQIFNDNIYL